MEYEDTGEIYCQTLEGEKKVDCFSLGFLQLVHLSLSNLFKILCPSLA